jgi:F420-0:gamma-glutamyl ligase
MISVEEVPNMPHINEGNDVGEIIVDVIRKNNIKIIQDDVLCVASKVISIAENNIVNLNDIEPSPLGL